jgi:hypothetical protein
MRHALCQLVKRGKCKKKDGVDFLRFERGHLTQAGRFCKKEKVRIFIRKICIHKLRTHLMHNLYRSGSVRSLDENNFIDAILTGLAQIESKL